jgi:hypothetical protein
MGPTGQKDPAQQRALMGAVAAGAGSVQRGREVVGEGHQGLQRAGEGPGRASESAVTQLQELDQEGRSSEMAAVVQSFEDENVGALTALKSQVKGREGMTLSQVVILVENVREVGRIASRL